MLLFFFMGQHPFRTVNPVSDIRYIFIDFNEFLFEVVGTNQASQGEVNLALSPLVASVSWLCSIMGQRACRQCEESRMPRLDMYVVHVCE